MKYIIELGEEANMVQAINVTQNGNVYVGAKYVTELEELNSDYINEHFGSLQDDAYQRGLEDGKAVHDKGCEGCKLQGTDSNICDQCCNSYANQWTAKDDKIEVGDEVEHGGSTGIVCAVGDLILSGLWTGDESFGPFQWYKEECKKTGRHFDIASGLTMRTCLLNDCTGFHGIAPCCLDCPEHDRCPDRCHKRDTTYCVGVIEHDCKGIPQTNNQDTQRD